jgi:hypothetical protein
VFGFPSLPPAKKVRKLHFFSLLFFSVLVNGREKRAKALFKIKPSMKKRLGYCEGYLEHVI